MIPRPLCARVGRGDLDALCRIGRQPDRTTAHSVAAPYLSCLSFRDMIKSRKFVFVGVNSSERFCAVCTFYADQIRASILSKQRCHKARGLFPAHDKSGEGSVCYISACNCCNFDIYVFSKNPDQSILSILYRYSVIRDWIIAANAIDCQFFSTNKQGNKSTGTLPLIT